MGVCAFRKLRAGRPVRTKRAARWPQQPAFTQAPKVAGATLEQSPGNQIALALRAMKTSGLPLTPREEQVLRRAALGRSDADIARQIGGTEAQVATQRLRLLRKLKICSHAEIIEAAINLGPWPIEIGRP